MYLALVFPHSVSADMTGNEPVTCQRLLSGQLYGMGHKELSTSTLLLER